MSIVGTIKIVPRLLALVAVLVVATLVYSSANDAKNNKKSKTRNVVHVVVSFLPAVRLRGQEVTVILMVDGEQISNGPVALSPRTWSLYPRVGQLVVVRAVQKDGQALACAITQRGSPDVINPGPGPGPGEVKCRHVTL